MKKILLRGGVLFAAFFVYSLHCNAQVVELPCPASTTSLQALQSFDNLTGKIRQNWCIDNAGNIGMALSNINTNIQFAGTGATPTCDQAVAALNGNHGLVVIPGTYSGPACSALVSTATIWDFTPNGAGGSGPMLFNTCTWTAASPSGLNSLLRCTRETTAFGPASDVSGYFINVPKNATAAVNAVIDGGSMELDFEGTLTGAVNIAQAEEDALNIVSTGGTILVATGAIGYVNTFTGSTTNITEARGLYGLGCNNIAGAFPATCIGVKAEQQTSGSVNNYALQSLGTALIQSKGGSSAILPTISPLTNGAMLIADDNVTLGSGTGKTYAVIGAARGSADASGDKAFGGWFKATAGNFPSTEVGLHAETVDTGGTLAEFAQNGANKFVWSGTGHANQGAANSDYAGKLTCAASTVTKTFSFVYASTPVVIVFDETTKGGANLTAISGTAFTVSCTGATDALDFIVIGNPN